MHPDSNKLKCIATRQSNDVLQPYSDTLGGVDGGDDVREDGVYVRRHVCLHHRRQRGEQAIATNRTGWLHAALDSHEHHERQ